MEDFNPAPYMRWAKYRPGARYDLSGSSLIACTREAAPGIMGDLPLTGPGPEGYPPLFEAIGRRYGAGPEQIAHASCYHNLAAQSERCGCSFRRDPGPWRTR